MHIRINLIDYRKAKVFKMILEINDRTCNHILELISQKKELNEKYDVLSEATNAPPFDKIFLTKEQLNELTAIFDEMEKLNNRINEINMYIAMCIESALDSKK